MAALTVTNRGTGTHNTSASSFACAPTSTVTAGTTGVLCVSIDNSGSGGSVATLPAGPITDSVGNVWKRAKSFIYDPGAASAGIEGAIYVCPKIVTALTSANSVTLSLGVAAVAKCWSFTQVEAQSGYFYSHDNGTTGTGTGAATGTPTVTTGSVTTYTAVIGLSVCESPNTYTGDSDTTNGSWSAIQTTSVGTTTSGVAIGSQVKIVTGAGAQTFNPTHTSSDTAIAYVTMPMEIDISGTADATLAFAIDAAGTAQDNSVTGTSAVAVTFSASASGEQTFPASGAPAFPFGAAASAVLSFEGVAGAVFGASDSASAVLSFVGDGAFTGELGVSALGTLTFTGSGGPAFTAAVDAQGATYLGNTAGTAGLAFSIGLDVRGKAWSLPSIYSGGAAPVGALVGNGTPDTLQMPLGTPANVVLKP